VSAHEILHDAARNGQRGIVLKLDYEKAYDKVDWVRGGSKSIKINVENSTNFKLGKGLRQEDPLSPCYLI
jgi:hypothetical protein